MTVMGRITVAELSRLYWISIHGEELDLKASLDVRRACLRGLERGITKIVIELTGVNRVSAEGIDMLQAAADELHAKHGSLSLVVRHGENAGRIDIRPVPAAGLTELAGLSAALDEALLEYGRLQLAMTAPAEGDDSER